MSMMLEADQRREWMKSRRKMRKAARRARSRRQTLRYMLLFALLVCGAACFTHLPWCLHNEKTEIIVHGNSVATRDQVTKLLTSALDVPIYRLDPKQLEHSLASLKAVRYAFVRRYALPHPRLVVEILEEYPWASFASDPKLPPQFVIAQSGRFIPVSEFPKVVKPKMVIYGQPTLKLTSREVSQWASWANYISEQTGRPVDSIDLRQPFDVRVQDGDLNMKLGMPDATLTRRLGRLVSILPTVESVKDRLEFIDLGLDNSIPLKVSKKPIVRDKNAVAGAPGTTATTDGQLTNLPVSTLASGAATNAAPANDNSVASGAAVPQEHRQVASGGTHI